EYLCRDTTKGTLSVNLWKKSDAALIVSAHSQQAGLEIGGHDWPHRWRAISSGALLQATLE
ncbi:MAG: tocopherol cyclase family protein, partial [Cyanobacteria bacterium J06642_11]